MALGSTPVRTHPPHYPLSLMILQAREPIPIILRAAATLSYMPSPQTSRPPSATRTSGSRTTFIRTGSPTGAGGSACSFFVSIFVFFFRGVGCDIVRLLEHGTEACDMHYSVRPSFFCHACLSFFLPPCLPARPFLHSILSRDTILADNATANGNSFTHCPDTSASSSSSASCVFSPFLNPLLTT